MGAGAGKSKMIKMEPSKSYVREGEDHGSTIPCLEGGDRAFLTFRLRPEGKGRFGKGYEQVWFG